MYFSVKLVFSVTDKGSADTIRLDFTGNYICKAMPMQTVCVRVPSPYWFGFVATSLRCDHSVRECFAKPSQYIAQICTYIYAYAQRIYTQSLIHQCVIVANRGKVCGPKKL